MAAAKRFDAFPLYWAGDQVGKWKLAAVLGLEGPGKIVTLIYGDCDVGGGSDASCAPPVQIQVSPLCHELSVITDSPRWHRPRVRGAPVADAAPVLLTARAQVKVYVGQGADAGTALRVFRQLRSLNHVRPAVGRADPFPAPSAGVLSSKTPCRG